MVSPRWAIAVACVAAAFIVSHADAASTTTVVDVPTRGVTQRFLHIRPDAPVANVVYLPGTNGILGIENDGSMTTVAGRCAPLGRSRDAFTSRGFGLALVDQTSDSKVRQFADVLEVVRYLRSRDNVPTWIVGASGSTAGVMNFAIEFPSNEPLGVVFLSPWKPDAARAARVTRPTLVVYHHDDPLSAPYVEPLFEALSGAPVKERVGLRGGTTGDCGGYHLFMGIDADLVTAIAGFIDRNNAFDAALTGGHPKAR